MRSRALSARADTALTSRVGWAASLALTLSSAVLPSCRRAPSPAERDAPGHAPAPALEREASPPAVLPPVATVSPLGAAAERRVITYERACMGTRCTIAAFHHDEALVEHAVGRAVAEIDRLDALMTTWTETSDVSRINALAGNGEAVPVSAETLEVLAQSLWVARASGGAFDITVGAFKGLWKFDEDNDGTLPSRSLVGERLKYVDHGGLILDSALRTARLARVGQSITLGGIAKGFIVDRAVRALRDAGLVDFLVQAGGDLYAAGTRGDRDWRVGILDPRAGASEERSTDTSFALLSLRDAAFNTSGDYERFVIKDGKRYHHILDPKTGQPVAHTRSVTVLAPTSFLADTLDTAVFVLGAKKGLELLESVPGAEGVIVDAKNQVHVSRGLVGRIKMLRPPTDAL